MSIEISVPFRLDENNRISVTPNAENQIRQHVMSLINTEPGERVVYGDYGIPLSAFIFENDDDSVAADLADDLTNQFAAWEPGVVLNSVRTLPRPDSAEARVEITYSRADSPDAFAFSRPHANTAYVDEAGQVSEVIRG